MKMSHRNEGCVHFQAPGSQVAAMNDIDSNTHWYSHICTSQRLHGGEVLVCGGTKFDPPRETVHDCYFFVAARVAGERSLSYQHQSVELRE